MTTHTELQALTDSAVARLTDLAQFVASLTHDQRVVLIELLDGLARFYRRGVSLDGAVATGAIASLQRLTEALQALYGDDPNEPISTDQEA